MNMKATGSNIPKTLQVGSRLKVADNSGARVVEIIGVVGYKGRHRRHPTAGVADVIVAAVKEGKPDIKHKIVKALIIRQRKPLRRPDGTRVMFEDNAVVIFKDVEKGEFMGTLVKGPVAREAVKRFPKLSRLSSMVI